MQRLLTFLIWCIAANAACTTITGTLTLPNGIGYNGSLQISWGSIPWQANDGTLIPSGPPISSQVKNGAVSVCLQPTDGTTVPTPIYYYVVYRPAGSSAVQQVWSVPTSGSPVALSAVIIPATSGPPIASGIITLNGLATPTQLLAKVNDMNVTLAWSSITSTHTLTAGWTGTLAVARGGSGAGTLTGLLKGNGTSAFTAATAGTDYIGGVANLTTVGGVPYISSTGTLNQDSLFNWGSTNDQLCIGCSSFLDSTTKLQVDASGNAAVNIRSTGGGNTFATLGLRSGGGGSTSDNADLSFFAGNTAKWTMAGVWNGGASFRLMDADDSFATRLFVGETTGNVLIGGTTDGNFKLDIQKSGSAGTLRVYDQTATTGETKLILRNGAANDISHSILEVYQNDGTSLMGFWDGIGDQVVRNAAFIAQDASTQSVASLGGGNANALKLSSDRCSSWSSGLYVFDTQDLALCRNSPGVLLVSDAASNPSYIRLLGGISSATTAYDSQLSNSTCAMPILTTNTNLQLRCKGSDGTVRFLDLTLAP